METLSRLFSHICGNKINQFKSIFLDKVISRKEYPHVAQASRLHCAVAQASRLHCAVAQASRLHYGDAGRMPALQNRCFVFWKSPK